MDTMTKRVMDSLEEIRLEGRGQGQAALVLRLVERKFGAAAARELSRLLEADGGSGQLTAEGDAVVDCQTTPEFLGRARAAMGID